MEMLQTKGQEKGELRAIFFVDVCVRWEIIALCCQHRLCHHYLYSVIFFYHGCTSQLNKVTQSGTANCQHHHHLSNFSVSQWLFLILLI